MHDPPLAALVLAGAVLTAGPARADGPDLAQWLFDRGLEDLKAGRYDVACPALARSHELDPRPGGLFTLAECEAKRGRLATAVKAYDAYLAVHAGLSPDKQARQGERAKIALARRAALGPMVPQLTVVLSPDAPRGTLVIRDGAAVAASDMGVPIAVDPGEHVILVQAPEGPVSEVRVTLVPREKALVPLLVRRAEPPPADARAAKQGPAIPLAERDARAAERGPEIPSAERPSAAWTVAGGAAAGAAATVGAVLAGLSVTSGSTAADLRSKLPESGCPLMSPGGSCAELKSAYARRDLFGNAAIWCFIGAGGVGAGTLIHALVTRRATPQGLRFAPSVGASGGGLMAAGEW